jgi:hypothetical protein
VKLFIGSFDIVLFLNALISEWAQPHSQSEHPPILSIGDGFANLLGRRIQKGLRQVGVVDDA